jgi:hypothetical protein
MYARCVYDPHEQRSLLGEIDPRLGAAREHDLHGDDGDCADVRDEAAGVAVVAVRGAQEDQTGEQTEQDREGKAAY